MYFGVNFEVGSGYGGPFLSIPVRSGAFRSIPVSKRTHYFGKNYVFLYTLLLIILFADDRAKKYGITPLSASGNEKYISGAADFGAVMAFIPDPAKCNVCNSTN